MYSPSNIRPEENMLEPLLKAYLHQYKQNGSHKIPCKAYSQPLTAVNFVEKMTKKRLHNYG